MTQGFLETIGKLDPEAAVDVVHLDVLRSATDSNAVFHHLLNQIQNQEYGMVVISDDQAIEMFRKHAKEIPSQIPFVFLAWHDYSPDIRKEFPNSTGLLQDWDLQGTLEFALKLFRNPPSEIAIIIDNSPTGKKLLKKAENLLKKRSYPPIRILNEKDYDLNALIRKMEQLPQNSLTIFTSWNTPDNGTAYSTVRGIGFLPASVSRGALFSPVSTWLNKGIDGGVMTMGETHGRKGAELVHQIIHGTPASSIPFREVAAVPVVDYQQIMKKPFLTMKHLPPETVVINSPPSFWIVYRFQLLIGICALLLILGVHYAAVRQKKKTQKVLSELFTSLPFQVGVTNSSGQILFYQNSSRHFSMKKPPKTISEMPDVIREKLGLAVREMFTNGKSAAKDYQYEGQQMHLDFVMLPHGVFADRSMMWITSDITQLHQAHQETAALLQRVQLILNSIGDGVIVTDENAKITRMNPVAARLTGISPENAEGMPLNEIFHLTDEKWKSPGNSSSGETLFLTPGGGEHHLAISAAPIFEEGKKTGTVLVFRDVTEEHKKQNMLSLQNELLNNAAEIAKIEYFHYDRNGKNITLSHDPFYWGRKDGRILSPKEWIAPEDYPEFMKQWKSLLDGKTDSIRISYRSLPVHGQRYFEMRVVKSRINDPHTKYFGIIQDITNSRENEQKYRDNATLLQCIISNMPGFLFVKNIHQDFRYVLCNKGFEKLCGRTAEEIVGHTDLEIIHRKEEAERFRKDDLSLFTDHPILDRIETCSDSDGNQYTIRILKTLVPQTDGTNLLLGVGIDVTREHQLERERVEMISNLNHYIYCERIINQCLKRLSLENHFDTAVREMLKIIGENNEADRCYIFRYSPDYQYSDNIFEWVRDGIEPQIQHLQHVDMSPYSCWQEILLRKQDIVVEDISAPPEGFEEVAAFLEKQNIKSILVCGIWIDEKLWGYIGMDFVRDHKKFTECDIHTIHSSMNLFLLVRERDLQKGTIADSVSLQQQIVETISIPIALFDLNRKIIASNPKFAEICRMEHKEMIHKKCSDVLCCDSEPPEWCPTQKAIRDHLEHHAEIQIHGRRLLLNAQPIFNRQNEIIHVLQTAIDITELTQQREQLRLAVRQARNADRAKSFFIATVSHELRTPLNAVIGFSELLQHTQVSPEEQKESLNAIFLAGHALLNMINDILDLSKIEADQVTIVPEALDLKLLFNELKTIFSYTAQSRHLAFDVEISPAFPILCLDHKRLRQVLINLIGNALKFTHEGSVKLDAMFQPETGTLMIRVEDTGIGIAPDHLKHMFEPFVQQKIRGTRIYEGTGLGLAISQRLCHKMGGRIEVTSTIGQGSCFTVILEHVDMERKNRPLLPADSAGGVSPVKEEPREPKTVLLLDDVPINLKVLGAMLKRMKIPYLACNTAKEAFEQLKQIRPALILTDIWMPDMNGEDFARAVQDNPETAHIPIVAVTADTEMTQSRKILFSGFLFKPVTSEKLRQVISPLLHQSSYRRQEDEEEN